MELHGTDTDEIGIVALPLDTFKELSCLGVSLDETMNTGNDILVWSINQLG